MSISTNYNLHFLFLKQINLFFSLSSFLPSQTHNVSFNPCNVTIKALYYNVFTNASKGTITVFQYKKALKQFSNILP